jgi:Beta-ketoacyl synthase, N-terminal domain
MSRTLSIMEQLAAEDMVSPADFSLSVHNALAGLLSIHARNRASHTALAAGPNSFGYALVEGIGWLAEHPDDQVLVCYGDDVLPPPYEAFKTHEDGLPMVVALLLKAAGPAGDDLTLEASAGLGAGLGAGTPQAAVSVEFLRFLLGPSLEHAAVGPGMTWRWRRNG